MLALLGCRERVAVERFGGVRIGLPDWKERAALGSPVSGSLERRDREGAAVVLGWDADERPGAPSEAEALAAAGLGQAAVARASAAGAGGHAGVEVTAGEASTLVWRCDKTRRLLRLAVDERAAAKVDLRALAARTACHAPGDKPVNGEVPAADVALLGEGFRFARRQPAAAAWLHEDAVVTLFSGLRTPGPRDPDAALQLAPGWALAAGLAQPRALAANWVAGPSRHQALRVIGRALLDGAPVRFTLLQWRCIARGKSFAAIVFTRDAARPAALPSPVERWTPHDGALSGVRCHG